MAQIEFYCEKSRAGIPISDEVPWDIWEFRRDEEPQLVRNQVQPGELERRRRHKLVEQHRVVVDSVMKCIPYGNGSEYELRGFVRADLCEAYCGDKTFRKLLSNTLLCDHPDYWSRIRRRSENNRWHYYISTHPPDGLKNLKNLNNRLSDKHDGIPF